MDLRVCHSDLDNPDKLPTFAWSVREIVRIPHSALIVGAASIFFRVLLTPGPLFFVHGVA